MSSCRQPAPDRPSCAKVWRVPCPRGGGAPFVGPSARTPKTRTRRARGSTSLLQLRAFITAAACVIDSAAFHHEKRTVGRRRADRAADGARLARSWRGSGGGAPPAVWSREMRWRTEVAKMTRAWESSTKVDEGEVEKQEVGRASALISEEARCGPNIGERALAWHGSRGGVVRRCPPRECVCARAYKPVNTQ